MERLTKQKNENRGQEVTPSPSLLTVPLMPPGCVQKLPTVMQQELVVGVLRCPPQQGQQVPAVNHPAGRTQHPSDRARTSGRDARALNMSLGKHWGGRPRLSPANITFGCKITEDQLAGLKLLSPPPPNLIMDAKINYGKARSPSSDVRDGPAHFISPLCG